MAVIPIEGKGHDDSSVMLQDSLEHNQKAEKELTSYSEIKVPKEDGVYSLGMMLDVELRSVLYFPYLSTLTKL